MSVLGTAVQMFRQRRAMRPLIKNYLLFSETLDTSLWGSLPEAGMAALTTLVQQAGQFDGPIIEIGTLFGFTTQAIAEIKRPDQPLISVDNYSWNPFCLPSDHHRAFTRRVLSYCSQHTNLQLYDGTSEDFFRGYRGPTPALVFLDGSHEYAHVLNEIRHAKRLRTHIICGDDHNEAFPGVVRAVAEELGTSVLTDRSFWWSVQGSD